MLSPIPYFVMYALVFFDPTHNRTEVLGQGHAVSEEGREEHPPSKIWESIDSAHARVNADERASARPNVVTVRNIATPYVVRRAEGQDRESS